MNTNLELTEEAVRYLDTLEPEERDSYYRTLQQRKDAPPRETLEELTERLAELGRQPGQDRDERKKVATEIDKRLILKAETNLALFINDALERGGAVDTVAIKSKAKSLGLPIFDVTPQINEVVRLRQIFADREAKRLAAQEGVTAEEKDAFWNKT